MTNFAIDADKNIDQQLQDFDLLRAAKEWTDEQAYAHLALAIPSNVRHKIILKTSDQAKPDAYVKLKKRLAEYFKKITDKTHLWNEFTNASIKPGETVAAFFDRISALLGSARPEWTESDRDFLLRPKIIQAAPPIYQPIIQSQQDAELRTIVRECDNFRAAREASINAIQEPDEKPPMESCVINNSLSLRLKALEEAVQSLHIQKSCQKCGYRGHSATECKGTVVCHNCKDRGHIRRKCPRLSGNDKGANFSLGAGPRRF